MALDLRTLGDKLKRYRDQLQLSLKDLAFGTGINESRLEAFESGVVAPSGDEVLILADFYKCDYRFFVSNERLAPFEQTENLYRRHGKEFSKEDRWRVQEFLFLCECEEFLIQALQRTRTSFRFVPEGTYFKGHAEKAATALRKHFGYDTQSVPSDVYADFRQIGVHVFRRQLSNSNISGVMLRHPVAGPCILVNYSEDIYRQRFTAAHEGAHAILDKDEFVVSFESAGSDLVEIRANAFASRYLLPPEVLKKIPVQRWNETEVSLWANKLKVSTTALAIGLKESDIINDNIYGELVKARVRSDLKTDPELEKLSEKALTRKRTLLQRGLSFAYVSLCFDALSEGIITNAKTAELLLTAEDELPELAALFNVRLLVHE
jgi:Zn-dependent peptidase ImmA (M78 family)/transcriptional regulator with XRE-family HTH domain